MTKIQRRRTAEPMDSNPSPTRRQQDVGVPTDASIAVTAALLRYDRDTDQPFCTCGKPTDHGFGFDPQMGLYVHADPNCWKPSKAMYALGIKTGTLEGVLEPKENSNAPSRHPARSDRRDVHAERKPRR